MTCGRSGSNVPTRQCTSRLLRAATIMSAFSGGTLIMMRAAMSSRLRDGHPGQTNSHSAHTSLSLTALSPRACRAALRHLKSSRGFPASLCRTSRANSSSCHILRGTQLILAGSRMAAGGGSPCSAVTAVRAFSAFVCRSVSFRSGFLSASVRSGPLLLRGGLRSPIVSDPHSGMTASDDLSRI